MMEQMPWVIATLMTLLLIGICGMYLTVRIVAGRNVKDDHPTARTPAVPGRRGVSEGSLLGAKGRGQPGLHASPSGRLTVTDLHQRSVSPVERRSNGRRTLRLRRRCRWH
jgi:hypothetical protein